MKLSEAMLAGAKEVKQIKGSFIKLEGDQKCACALGAAILHAKPEVLEDQYESMGCVLKYLDGEWSFNRVLNVRVKSPVGGESLPLELIVMTLNDTEGWSIEQIGNWLQEQGF